MMVSHARRKAKGIAAERELIHLFESFGWAAVRVAASGAKRTPAADIIAGRRGRIIAFEVKVTRDEVKYLSTEEVKSLIMFAERAGMEAWLAVRFPQRAWRFIPARLAVQTGRMVKVSVEDGLDEQMFFRA